jgi:hypothetical protein
MSFIRILSDLVVLTTNVNGKGWYYKQRKKERHEYIFLTLHELRKKYANVLEYDTNRAKFLSNVWVEVNEHE